MVQNLPASTGDARDTGLAWKIPWADKLGGPHGVTKGRTQLSAAEHHCLVFFSELQGHGIHR